MRAYHKGWKDKLPGDGKKTWSRRVRWFEGPMGNGVSIRLCFEEVYPGGGGRKVNRFYGSVGDATLHYEAFIAGTLTTQALSRA